MLLAHTVHFKMYAKWTQVHRDVFIPLSSFFGARTQFGVCKFIFNKKVLLRERKRHTARRVASTPYVVLTGYPVLTWLGGYPTWVPPRAGSPPGRIPPRQGTPPVGPGRVPPTPLGICPMAFWEMLHSIMGYGYPPLWTDRQTRVKTLPFPSYYVRGR